MFGILFIIAILIPIIAVGQAVLSVRIIRRHEFGPSMFVRLGALYFVAVVMGMVIKLAAIFLGGDYHGDLVPPSIFLTCPTAIAALLSFLVAIIPSVRAYLKDSERKGQGQQGAAAFLAFVIDGGPNV